MKLIKVFSLFILINLILTLETIYISKNTSCLFCNGSSPENAIENLFLGLKYIESSYRNDQTFDFEIIIYDSIHILDGESLKNIGISNFDQNLGVYSFLSSLKNLNLTLKSHSNNQNSILYIRTNNFTIFLGRCLAIMNIEFYGNDMIFYENNYKKKLNLDCLSMDFLCCQNSELFNQSSEPCEFINKNLSDFTSNSTNPHLALFFIIDNSFFDLVCINTTFNNFIAFNGYNIKYSSFIYSFMVQRMNIYFKNVRSENCFYRKSFINMEEIDDSIYFVQNFSIYNYNSLKIITDQNLENLTINPIVFFNIKKSRNITFSILDIKNSKNVILFYKCQNVYITYLTFCNFNLDETECSNAFIINESWISFSYITISNILMMNKNITFSSSIFAINENNQIQINSIQISNIILPMGFSVLNLNGNNNTFSLIDFYGYNLFGNGTLINSSGAMNFLNLSNFTILNISIILFMIEDGSNLFLYLSDIQNFKNENLEYLIYFGSNNILYFNSCIFSNEKLFNGNDLGGSSLFKINKNNVFLLNKTDFKQFNMNFYGLLYILNKNKIYITETQFINISSGSSGVIYSLESNTFYIKSSYFIYSNGKSLGGGVIYIQGYNNDFSVCDSIFINNTATYVGAIGWFNNFNNISIFRSIIIVFENNFQISAKNIIYTQNSESIKINSCFIYSGAINFLEANGIINIFFSNNSIIKSPNFYNYEFFLSNISNFFINQTIIQGDLATKNSYSPIFYLFQINIMVMNYCSFMNFNILLDFLGGFYLIQNLIAENSVFENMISTGYDLGYILQSNTIFGNTTVHNCTFKNISSLNQQEIFYFESSNFVEISESLFINSYSKNIYDYDISYIIGSAILYGLNSELISIYGNKFVNCIQNDSLFGLLLFESSNIYMSNNIFEIDYVLVGSIFRLMNSNQMIFTNNLIVISNSYSINSGTNYSYINVFNSNIMCFKNITFLFPSLLQNLTSESLGFLIDMNTGNNIIIENFIFVNNEKIKIGSFCLFNLNIDNQIRFINSYFNNLYISSLIYSMQQNRILINHTSLMKFFDGVIFSSSNNEIFINYSKFSSCICNQYAIINLIFSNNFTSTESVYENFVSVVKGTFYGYDSNRVILLNSQFKNITNYENGGVLFFSMNNVIFIFNINAQNIIASSAGFAYLENKNFFSAISSFFYNISCFSYGGSFLLLSQNLMQMIDCKINYTYSSNYAGFLISYSENIIKIKKSLFINSFAFSKSGGLIYLIFNSTLYVYLSNFKNIHAEKESGGIIKADNINIILIKNTSFFNTSALKGGIIFLESSNLLIFLLVYGENVTAFLYGGSINCNYLNEVKLLNSTFYSSKSELDGGFLYSTSQNIIELSQIHLNYSVSNQGLGGGVYLDYENNLIFNVCYFMNLFSTAQGSFLYLRNENKINISLIKIENSGNYISSNYMYSSLIESHFKNILMLNKAIFIGDLSCGNIFSLNNSQLNFSFGDISHSQKYIFSIFYAENSFLNIYSAKLQYDYENLCYSINSTIKMIHIKKTPSLFITFNQIHFVLISSIVFIKSFYLNSGQNNLNNSIQFIYSLESKLVLTKINVIEVCNKFEIKLFELVNSNFKIKSSVFLFNKQKSKSNSSNFDIIFSSSNEKDFECLIKNTIFLGNAAYKFSSSINIQSNSIDFITKLKISNNLFILNDGNLGGSLFISNISNTSIIRTNFIKNKAELEYNNRKAKGGAIHCLLQIKKNTFLLLKNNLFSENLALIGGAIYINDPFSQNHESLNRYLGNYADLYGNNKASDINALSFLNKDSPDVIDNTPRIVDVISGHNYSTDLLKIGAFDKFNNFLYQTDENFLQRIEILEENSSSNQFNFVQESGYLSLKGLIKRNELPISLKFNYIIRFAYLDITSELKFSLNFKNCNIGERLSDDYQCLSCPYGTYIFTADYSTSSGACNSCSRFPFTCYGGDNIVPQRGFWRYSSHSSKFLQCFIQANCLGDNNILNSSNYLTLLNENMKIGLCNIGYEGPLCSVCSESYGKIDKYTCVRCDDRSYSTVLILSTIIRVGFVLASVYYATEKCNAISRNSQNSINKVFKSNLLKMMTNHMQVLLIISAFPFEWPTQFNLFFGYFFSISPNVAQGFSMECFIKIHNYNINSNYLKLELIAVYPIMLLFISLMVLKGIKKFKKFYKICKKRFRKTEAKINSLDFRSIRNRRPKLSISFGMKIICVFAIILYNCYQDIIQYVLQMFSCIEIADPDIAKISQRRLLIDLSVDCDSKYHQNILYFLVLPLLLIIGVLFPILLSFFLGKLYRKGDLNKPENLYKFGYFYYAYKRPYHYWDFIILSRKTILLFIYCIFFTGKQIDDVYPIFILLIVLIVNLIVHIETKPFDVINFNLLNILEKYSLSSLSMTMYLSLFLFTYLSNNNNYRVEVFYTTVSLMGLSNFIFFFKWFRVSIKHLIKPQIETYIHKTATIINSLKNRFSSRTPSATNLSTNQSVQSLEDDRKLTIFEKFKRASFEIIKQKQAQEQNNEKNYLENQSNENQPSFSSLNHIGSKGGMTRRFSNKMIIEEDEEESPLRPPAKRKSNKNELFALTPCGMDIEQQQDTDEFNSPKLNSIKRSMMKFYENNIYAQDLFSEHEIQYSKKNLHENLENLDENLKKFEEFIKSFEENRKQRTENLFINKNDFVFFSLEDNSQKILIENKNFEIEGIPFLREHEILEFKILIKSKVGNFQNFQIKFIEAKDILYKYDITYLSSEDSPSKHKGKIKIKNFFSPKDRIIVRLYIKFIQLSYVEIFSATINFTIMQEKNETVYNILFDVPISLNKFVSYTETNNNLYSERNLKFYSENQKIKIHFDLLSNIDVLKKFFPFCKFDQDEETLKIYGNFIFLGDSQKEVYFYEFILKSEKNEIELKLGYWEDGLNQKHYEAFSKKICNNYSVLLSELFIETIENNKNSNNYLFDVKDSKTF